MLCINPKTPHTLQRLLVTILWIATLSTSCFGTDDPLKLLINALCDSYVVGRRGFQPTG